MLHTCCSNIMDSQRHKFTVVNNQHNKIIKVINALISEKNKHNIINCQQQNYGWRRPRQMKVPFRSQYCIASSFVIKSTVVMERVSALHVQHSILSQQTIRQTGTQTDTTCSHEIKLGRPMYMHDNQYSRCRHHHSLAPLATNWLACSQFNITCILLQTSIT